MTPSDRSSVGKYGWNIWIFMSDAGRHCRKGKVRWKLPRSVNLRPEKKASGDEMFIHVYCRKNFKNHPGLHRVRVCHWSAVDVFCSWFYERGLVLDTSQVHVVSDYLSLFIALLFWILRLFFFSWRRCELSNLPIVCRIYRCFQVSRYQVSWYVNQPRGLTAWCANIPLSVV